MMPGDDGSVIDLKRLRRSCRECSLRTLCLPAGVGSEGIERLDGLVQALAPIDGGAFVFRAGEAFRHFYVVRSGALRTTQPADEGDDQVVGFHLPGELVGLEGVCEGVHRSDAMALERTSLCAVPLDDLQEVALEVPALQEQFHRLFSRELLQDQLHLVELGRRTARERVALFLDSHSRRLAAAGYDGREFRLAMSRDDIARYLGLATETVSRVLRRLAEDGVIEIRRRRAVIRDAQALGEASGVAQAPGPESGNLGRGA